MSIRFHASATKHGISRGRPAYVVSNCRCPSYVSDEDREESDLLIFLGADANGIPLEVIGVELDGGDVLVIHAMRLRRKYEEE